MRILLGTASLSLVLIALAACSGKDASPDETSEDQANAAPGPSASTDPTPTAPTAKTDPTPAPVTDGGKGGGGDGGGGGGGDGGGGGGGDGGGGGNNALCEASSVHETEANDSAATANAIPAATGSFCGTLATAADVDFLSFTLPATATKLAFGDAYSQQGLTVEIEVDGQKANVGEKPPFKPGGKYVLKVQTTGKAPVSYRVSVEITK